MDLETENDKIIQLIQRSNNYPGPERLIKLVQQAQPNVTRSAVNRYLRNHVVTQQTKIQKKPEAIGHIKRLSLMKCGRWTYSTFQDIRI